MKPGKITVGAKKFITICISLFLLPLAVFLIIYNIISISSYASINTEIAQTGKNTIEMYQSITDIELNSTSLQIADFWANDSYHRSMLFKTDDVTVYYSVHEISKKYRTLMSNSMSVRGMMLYAGENNVTHAWLQENFYPYEFGDKIIDTMEYLAKNADIYIKLGWFPLAIDEHTFLFRIIGYHNSYTVAMIDVNDLCARQNKNITNKNGFLYYTLPDGTPFTQNSLIQSQHIQPGKFGEPYYLTSGKERFLVTNKFSNTSGLQTLYFIPYNSSVPFMQQMQLALFFVSLLVILLIPALYIILSRSFFKPIENLNTTIQHIREGKIEEKVETGYAISELQNMSTTFNKMIGEIKDLKIASYEKELLQRQAEMQYYQLQLKPHFFLNCLKIIYSMVEQKKYDKIQPMLLQTSQYLRYCFKDNTALVTLEEELEHVKNYISLQENSSLLQIQYSAVIEPPLEKSSIPVMLLQTFVENCFKYAQKQGSILTIKIKVICLHTEDGDFMDIILSDNGNGFPEDVLLRLNSGASCENQQNSIGIYNVQQRLALLYPDAALVQCSNTPEGAQCEIVLPVEYSLPS